MTTIKTFEVNFDGLAGPTHNYAGMSLGNLASLANANQTSNPKAAALEGLEKMRILMDLRIPQAVLPPHERPNIPLLQDLGFRGNTQKILKKVYAENREIFKAIYSASSMWAANSATVSPSCDSLDKKVHITVANLVSHLHRAQESETTYLIFKKIFSDEKYFTLHRSLMMHPYFADEGSANHNRFCSSYGEQGLQMFVYGRNANDNKAQGTFPKKFPARQTLEASLSIARLHQLHEEKQLFIKQNPIAIDQGVFHNDVISTANQSVFLYHESAFENMKETIENIKSKLDFPAFFLSVTEKELPLALAIQTYLFNSQIVTLEDGSMVIIAPMECSENENANRILMGIRESDNNPIQLIQFVDCRQSMKNGGGPACLRLRVVLNEAELKACLPTVFLDDKLYLRLVVWVEAHYRDRLTEADLLDPALVQEAYTALDELTQILHLGSIYSFQKL